MEPVAVRLLLVVIVVVVAASINYHALATAADQPSKIRTAAMSFGVMGVLLIVLPFFPLLALFLYFTEISGAAIGMAMLFNVALVGAAVCTVGSLIMLVAKTIADRKSET